MSICMQRVGNIAIRVEANSEIGLGHLRRCLTLAKQLFEDGFCIYIISLSSISHDLLQGFHHICIRNMYESLAKSNIFPNNFNKELLDAECTLTAIKNLSIDWVVLDSYNLGISWEQRVAESGYKILVIDDFRNRAHYADIVLSDIDIPFNKNLLKKSTNCHQLVGLKYALIDSYFITAKNGHKDCTLQDNRKKILISYGGSDPTGETIKVLESIRLLMENHPRLKQEVSVDVVVGCFNSNFKIIKEISKNLDEVKIHYAPDSLANLLKNADIFLTSGGNSMIEGLFMQKTCLITTTSKNQILSVMCLLKKNSIYYLGHYNEVKSHTICDFLLKSIKDDSSSKINHNLVCDHLGASRVSRMLKLIMSK
ncbi:UDP-2,4-diacetamido-2,4,6-trideoxy-beta-L-altropyranose hydrolase [Thermosynechococcus sp. HN-54]|uniref:UDP-2,4-diacetamido-2,4, 6-trideoxy-beta-L-altropyranose hydrolase n=1 Tax=Thermosynechococcus sp. HN-54 TaxID=2933959 RepID=UPI00202CD108|nr:UDP-2,4-diacetamido-2,4,6-trideoxy-beta-L-altropyranose hydrolase [Thermosynechococcus sp. HN-54]URR34933.1 UDP-2,4-diacetamido-2,4,6-trideoxy-beta-L-altropyranose hydrolase [Thermosynechococcus sp. HN-54]